MLVSTLVLWPRKIVRTDNFNLAFVKFVEFSLPLYMLLMYTSFFINFAELKRAVNCFPFIFLLAPYCMLSICYNKNMQRIIYAYNEEINGWIKRLRANSSEMINHQNGLFSANAKLSRYDNLDVISISDNVFAQIFAYLTGQYSEKWVSFMSRQRPVGFFHFSSRPSWNDSPLLNPQWAQREKVVPSPITSSSHYISTYNIRSYPAHADEFHTEAEKIKYHVICLAEVRTRKSNAESRLGGTPTGNINVS